MISVYPRQPFVAEFPGVIETTPAGFEQVITPIGAGQLFIEALAVSSEGAIGDTGSTVIVVSTARIGQAGDAVTVTLAYNALIGSAACDIEIVSGVPLYVYASAASGHQNVSVRVTVRDEIVDLAQETVGEGAVGATVTLGASSQFDEAFVACAVDQQWNAFGKAIIYTPTSGVPATVYAKVTEVNEREDINDSRGRVAVMEFTAVILKDITSPYGGVASPERDATIEYRGNSYYIAGIDDQSSPISTTLRCERKVPIQRSVRGARGK